MLNDIKFTITINTKEPVTEKQDPARERRNEKRRENQPSKFDREIIAMEKERDRNMKKAERERTKRARDRQGRISAGAGAFTGLATNPAGFAAGQAAGLLTRFFGPAAIAFIALEVAKVLVKDILFAPGGAFDRRLRIEIEKQINTFARRQELADRNLGKSIVRATSAGGLRGRIGSVGGNLEDLKAGRQRDIDFGRDLASLGV